MGRGVDNGQKSLDVVFENIFSPAEFSFHIHEEIKFTSVYKVGRNVPLSLKVKANERWNRNVFDWSFSG